MSKRFGRWDEVEAPEVLEPGVQYSGKQLDAYAEKLLREDARSELCRKCDGKGHKTGEVSSKTQALTDEQGTQLSLDFSEYKCANGHRWFAGEGAMRGIGGKNPVLFKEHFDSRRRREIFCAVGTPDPEIVSGLYNRAHPLGRKINSPEQRKRHGASYYR